MTAPKTVTFSTTPDTCPICRGGLTRTVASQDCLRLDCACGLMILYNTTTGAWWRVRNGRGGSITAERAASP